MIIKACGIWGGLREVSQRAVIGTRWSDEGVVRVTRLLARVQINRMKLKNRGQMLYSSWLRWYSMDT
jgi:hypothetical protein